MIFGPIDRSTVAQMIIREEVQRETGDAEEIDEPTNIER
jgi:hypothetical protein